jgi:hypothetical protein
MSEDDDQDWTEDIVATNGGDSIRPPWTPPDPDGDWTDDIEEKGVLGDL